MMETKVVLSENKFQVKQLKRPKFEQENDRLWIARTPVASFYIRQMHNPVDGKPYELKFKTQRRLYASYEAAENGAFNYLKYLIESCYE